MMKWTVLNEHSPANPSDLKKIIIDNRKITNEEEFFNPTHPIDLSLEQLGIDSVEVKKAIQILLSQKEKSGKIIIFGDYDADGICATAILWRVLYDLGFDVLPFIPDRQKHGYGLTTSAIDDIITASPPNLIITVDNGIVAHEALNYLKEKKIKVIVTDHHSEDEITPQADAVVHTTLSCGAGVAWILAREVLKNQLGDKYVEVINKELDLAGIATIADQVPLLDINRSFAKWGIDALGVTKRTGLKEMMSEAKISQKGITSSTINFGIAPRINAMGRLKSGLSALKLLCTTNSLQAKQLSHELNQTNADRQDMTYAQLLIAEEQVKEQSDQKLLIAFSDQFHEGIIGLIAGKIMEKHYKPAIVISHDDETGKASARSIPGIDIVNLIREVKQDLLAVGGHPMAAGFGLTKPKIATVKEKLQQIALDIDDDLFEKSLKVECLMDLDLVNEQSFQTIRLFSPFGQKNREPIIGFTNLKVIDIKTLGKENTHLKLIVSNDNSQFVPVLFWRQGALASKINIGDTIDIAGYLSENVWRDKVQMQVIAKDIKPKTN